MFYLRFEKHYETIHLMSQNGTQLQRMTYLLLRHKDAVIKSGTSIQQQILLSQAEQTSTTKSVLKTSD